MGKVLKVREVGDPILEKECYEVDIKNINKDILDNIEDTDVQYEGCMSVPSIRGKVERYKNIIRDPYVLEFLGLEGKASFYEKDLEQAIIDHLQKFLLKHRKDNTNENIEKNQKKDKKLLKIQDM